MKRSTAYIALAGLLFAGSALAQTSIPSTAQESLRQAGFSNSFISRIKRDTPVRQRVVDARSINGAGETLPPPPAAATPDSGQLPSLPQDTGASAGGESGASPLPIPTTDIKDPGAKETGKAVVVKTSTKTAKKAGKKSSSGSKSTKKKSKKKKSSAPIRSSYGYPAPIAETPANQSVLPPPPPLGNGDQEIYSQEPVRLPPVSALPTPSRTTLPPVSQDTMMQMQLGEAVSRVLACSFSGLTGLNQVIAADVSRAGSFKMGFHSSWYSLDRVYNRVLASGESGELLEMPLFFNYAVTNDLEFALRMPVLNYTIKSRILWTKDFRESGVGDTKLSFKYRVFDNQQYQMRGAFGLGFKFPTGSDDKGFGTGQTDFEVFTAFSKSFERVIGHLNLGYVMTGDPNTQFYPDGLADIFYWGVGIEYPHTNNVTVAAEVHGMDQGAEGMKIDVAPTLRYTPSENFAFDVGVPIAVTNDMRYGYNYRLTFGATAFFK